MTNERLAAVIEKALETLGRIEDEVVEVIKVEDMLFLLYDDKTYSIVQVIERD